MTRTLLLSAMALLVGCSDGGGSGGGGGGGTSNAQGATCATGSAEAAAVDFEIAFGGAVFASPLKLVQHPADDDRFYVVEQGGTVQTLLKSDPAASLAEAVDVGDFRNLSSGGETGLLGMAFDPDFGVNGEVFFSYTEVGITSELGRFASADGGMTFAPAVVGADVMSVAQPAGNHNGGDIEFGPDGYLYWALGDGGGAGDPFENGQDTATLLGSILRLDVAGGMLQVPADNPFAQSAGADEIYAFGLRNPWRMSFDSVTGELWVGDVGQNAQEEIDRIVAGGNYGWDCYEGIRDFEIQSDPAGCVGGPIPPEVAHDQPSFRSITGGYVYRGSAIPELQGAYVYGDYISGEVCALFFDENPARVVSLEPPNGLFVSSFGQDRDGELYLIDYLGNPSIYQIVPAP